MVLGLAGGLWWFSKADREPEGPTAVATSCSGFAADAQKLFDHGETAALSGRFAPGDRVHLAVDFSGIGYSWELTGVLSIARKANVTGSGSFSTVQGSAAHATSNASTTSTSTHGDISGFARLEVEIVVSLTGDGAIKINKSGKLPSLWSPRVASASCDASPRSTK